MQARHLLPYQMQAFKGAVFIGALVPLGSLVWGLVDGSLGPDLGKTLTRALGIAAFQLLLVTLAMSPLQKISGMSAWVRVRRMLGLFSFFYAALHFLAFLHFIAGWRNLLEEVTERPFVTLGFLALLFMVPLALTSTKGMMRRLGKRWKSLHRLIYPIAVIAWIHFLWQARSDVGEELLYGLVLAALLGFRLYRWRVGRKET